MVKVTYMEASRAVENKTHTIRIIVDHLESLPDVAQLEVLDFVEFLQTRKMLYEERRADDKSWCNFSNNEKDLSCKNVFTHSRMAK